MRPLHDGQVYIPGPWMDLTAQDLIVNWSFTRFTFDESVVCIRLADETKLSEGFVDGGGACAASFVVNRVCEIGCVGSTKSVYRLAAGVAEVTPTTELL